MAGRPLRRARIALNNSSTPEYGSVEYWQIEARNAENSMNAAYGVVSAAVWEGYAQRLNECLRNLAAAKAKTAKKNPGSRIPSNAPQEVRQVAETLIKNGAEAELPPNLAAYVRFSNGEWIVGPNFEGSGAGMSYRNGLWFYIDYEGERKPMKNGFQEALSNASIWYTG